MSGLSRGAEWRKWDLHVHSPASIKHRYTGETDPWDRFLTELEALPPEFAVLGINDYWFLDGYRRVRQEYEAGRLQNLEDVFPVLELRIDQFGGAGSALSRVNLHVIFDPAVGVDVIEQQFLSAMQAKFRLMPGLGQAHTWGGIVTQQALADLGASIKASVPADRKADYGSDLEEGFNNLVVSLDNVEEALARPYFENRYVLALGKTEWASIRWQDGSVASKKHLVNSVKMLFTAFEDPTRWATQVQQLERDNVCHHLVDCSDAHTWSAAESEKDRIGNCATWLKAAPRFSGLVHALAEFDSRVYVGVEPADLIRRRTYPEHILDAVRVSPVDPGVSNLFDYELPLNQGLVAVIGNKGQGKSALLDCIARAGNSSRDADFGFLTRTRFLAPKNAVAKNFTATVTWASGESRLVGLHEGFDPALAESLEYLPQKLIERICSSDPQSEHREAFESELRRVLFHHIDPVDRQGQASLDDLMTLRTKGIEREIQDARERLGVEASRFVRLHETLLELNPVDLSARRDELVALIGRASEDLAVAQQALADAEQAGAVDPELLQQRARLTELDDRLGQLEAMNTADVAAAAEATRRLSELDSLISDLELVRVRVAELDQQFVELLQLTSVSGVVSLSVDQQLLDERRRALDTERERLTRAMENRTPEIEDVRVKRRETEERLALIDSQRDLARRNADQLAQRVQALRGSADDPQTLQGVEALLARADRIPAEIEDVRESIIEAARRLHTLLTRRLETMRQLYMPAAEFVDTNELARETELEFVADLSLGARWSESVRGLDARKNAELIDFFESQAGEMDVASQADVVHALTELLDRIVRERGAESGSVRPLRDGFRTNTDISRWLQQLTGLEWIETRFSLHGHGLPLDQLSPGERGLILLLFYLVVDQSATPLLLDQPEENLDNTAVRRVLVGALKQARLRRQVVIVTHNANLAIVGDADQIVHCRQEAGRFLLESGTLAEAATGEESINVLEGARPAFDNRKSKYDTVVPKAD
ncbi:MAG TPA: AAA family ATPase [Mycobacteriales bacterium]|nr:AAA family ATPase [Mycobacteriales bacterium]